MKRTSAKGILLRLKKSGLMVLSFSALLKTKSDGSAFTGKAMGN
jgi:hypothetical protein